MIGIMTQNLSFLIGNRYLCVEEKYTRYNILLVLLDLYANTFDHLLTVHL